MMEQFSFLPHCFHSAFRTGIEGFPSFVCGRCCGAESRVRCPYFPTLLLTITRSGEGGLSRGDKGCMSSTDLVVNSFIPSFRREGGKKGETEVWRCLLSARSGAGASLVCLTHSGDGGIISISHTRRRKPSETGPLV